MINQNYLSDPSTSDLRELLELCIPCISLYPEDTIFKVTKHDLVLRLSYRSLLVKLLELTCNWSQQLTTIQSLAVNPSPIIVLAEQKFYPVKSYVKIRRKVERFTADLHRDLKFKGCLESKVFKRNWYNRLYSLRIPVIISVRLKQLLDSLFSLTLLLNHGKQKNSISASKI